METEIKNLIHKALKALAGIDDGAQREDGMGFNSFDTAFGNELAETETLSDGAARAAFKMIKKYKRQLAGAGIVLPDALPEETVKSAWEQGRSIYMTFDGKPSMETRTFIKTFKGWKWNPDRKDAAWSVPATPENKKAIMEHFACAIDMVIDEKSEPEKPAEPDIEIAVTDREIRIYFNVKSPAWRAKLDEMKAAIPERKWMADEPRTPWAIPGRYASQVQKLFPSAKGIEDLNGIAEQLDTLTAMSNKASGSTLEIPGLRGELMPFQRVGVEYVDLAKGRAIIGDDMGLGKTVQAIAYLQLHKDRRPAVIVCPASLKGNWHRHVINWMEPTRENSCIVISGGKTLDLSLTGAKIIIINYDVLPKWIEAIKAWGPKIVIMDEAHYCKNRDTNRAAAARMLAKISENILLLTGTPVTNRPAELYPLLSMVAPSAWGSWTKFARRYCGLEYNGYGYDSTGATNLDELHRAIKPYMIRRTKGQVLTELPAKRWATVAVDFDDSAQVEYDKLLEQAENDVAGMGQAEQLVLMEKLKQLCVRAKLPAAIQWIKEFLESGEKLVIFATHKETITALENAFPGSVTIDGGTKNEDRQKIVDRFQNDPAVKIFIGNIKAAGVGLTLTAASNVVMLEFPWTPGDLIQATDRCHRIGQKESVTVWSIVAENTIDEDLLAILEEKRIIIETIHDGKQSDISFAMSSVLEDVVKRITSTHIAKRPGEATIEKQQPVTKQEQPGFWDA